MKVQNMTLIFLSLILLFSPIFSLSNTFQEEIHEDCQFPKVVTLEDQSVLIFSSVIGEKKCLETKLDKKGEYVYGDISHNQTISGSDVLTAVKAGLEQYSILIHHGGLPQEMITRYNQNNFLSSIKEPNSKYFVHKSVVPLKCGKIVIAGIRGTTAEQEEADIEVNLYDPKTNSFGNGVTLKGKGNMISCYEQKENQVYCSYVTEQYHFVSKLTLQLIEVNPTSNALTSKASQVIKTFYTVFNYLKAIPFNDKEGIVLFRVGNGDSLPKNGNSGKDLFYYHYEESKNETLVSGIRYEKLNSECRYRKGEEDESIDIAVLSPKRIYIACETDKGKLKGYIIYPGKTDVDEFYFNNFEAKDIKNPVFAKFEKSLGIFYTYINENNNYAVAFHLMNYPECMNYFDNRIIKIPKHHSKELDLSGKVFLNNPYPASRAKEKVNVIFEEYEGMSIINTKDNTKIQPLIEYDSDGLVIKITPEKKEGSYSLHYMATRKDVYDGKIEGKICGFPFITPICLEQCYSCDDTGTEEKHECLGCASDRYYKEEYEGAVNEGYGKPHNCFPCDKACYDCYYKFIKDPFPTTNCKRCDYDNGYYHLEQDEKTCISEETQEYWEGVYNRSMYLDQTSDNKKLWRWKFCHHNCKRCHGPGTDEDNQCDVCNEPLHFFCNQTKGNGIPGSCHADCVNNGFFLKESEGMDKCCPCLDDCKVCPDENTCNDCFKPFYLAPNNDSCVDDCGYCYAKDNITFGVWRCVNCLTDYPIPKYNLNGTCYDEIPLMKINDPDLYDKPYHVVNDTCNWLIGCKGGCLDCEWYTENCKSCLPGFYQEDFWNLPKPETFPCFTADECHGEVKYKFNSSLELGGIAKNISGVGVCYNCRLRENNYCQPGKNYVCGPRGRRTFILIPHYNKLGDCYFRCETCDQFSNACRQNCKSCREPSTYYLDYYPDSITEGDCFRIPLHKCGILPYYHDYDLAKELGIDEDSCGQDCDVCLLDGKCPKEFPFYVVSTRECIEVCGFAEVMSQDCELNHPEAIDIFIGDPFDLGGTLKELNDLEEIKKLIQISIIKKYAAELNIDVTTISQTINNYIHNGVAFNLPNSQLIIGNNISIEITTSELELLKLYNKVASSSNVLPSAPSTAKAESPNTGEAVPASPPTKETPKDTTAPTKDTTAPTKDTTAPAKDTTAPTKDTTAPTKDTTAPTKDTTAPTKDTTAPITKQSETQKVTSPVTESSLGSAPTPVVTDLEETPILNITECEQILKKYYNLSQEEQLLILKAVTYKEYDQYLGKDVSYNLISTSLWKSLSLEPCIQEHVKTYIINDFSAANLKLPLLQQNKIAAVANNGYDAFSSDSSFYNDICTPFTNENGNDVLIDDRRKDYFLETLNICKDGCGFAGYNSTTNSYSCECPTSGLSNENDKANKEVKTEKLPDDFFKEHTFSNIKVFKCATQVFSSKGQNKNFGSYILLACLTSFIGTIVFYFVKGTKLFDILLSGFIKEKVVANPPRKEDSDQTNRRSLGLENVNADELLFESSLNNADFAEAKAKDDRTYWKIYWSLLKTKQLLIFTFYTTQDGNLRVIKIALFILFISFYFAYTALFFNDSIMRNIYEYKGNTNAAIHVPNVILSSLCCLVMNFLVQLVSLNNRDYLRLKKDGKLIDKIKKKIKIKTIILFAISSALICLCWYYVSAFCAVFKNSQGHYLINVLAAFIVCNIWPCVTTLIAPALRKLAFKKESACLYKVSKIVAYF